MASEISVIDREILGILDLEKDLSLLLRWGQITGNQFATLLREISPHLPCLVMIDMRTKKGTARVVLAKSTGMTRFTVNNRAKVT
jgi:hypothetical protein